MFCWTPQVLHEQILRQILLQILHHGRSVEVKTSDEADAPIALNYATVMVHKGLIQSISQRPWPIYENHIIPVLC